MSVPAAVASRPPAPEPFYFGASQGLFGVYHAPQRVPSRSVAAVLCYPAGHEYPRVHRSFRNLAGLLTRLGFPVLRFDYGGTGDSAGDGASASLRGWMADLGTAIEEARRRSGLSRVALAGQRLGASLAWSAAAERSDVDLLVLWDPIVHGARYLSDLRALERTWLAEPERAVLADGAPNGHLLGFPMGDVLADEIGELDLGSGPFPRTPKVFAIMSSDEPKEAAWRERVKSACGPQNCGVLPTVNWNDPAAIHTAVYPQGALQIVARIFDKMA